MSDERFEEGLAAALVDLFMATQLPDETTVREVFDCYELEEVRDNLECRVQDMLDKYNEPKPSDWLVMYMQEEAPDFVTFCVVHRDFWEQYDCIDDSCIRDKVVNDVPGFDLVEGMESTFEFEGTLDEAKAYVTGLGMTILGDGGDPRNES